MFGNAEGVCIKQLNFFQKNIQGGNLFEQISKYSSQHSQ
ncbi:hypothetical protein SB48_HM08orf03268 [Heyndrickxia coagulans]|uniref:Uncharacterized protein n=1 Tax=Heyndrickxia coagulans TaxID=1398 RepID=A0AAN0T850_HEYCO|nr:hypothetical protein SB48_HM08orf03268 [Heyndrickxia coagulans]